MHTVPSAADADRLPIGVGSAVRIPRTLRWSERRALLLAVDTGAAIVGLTLALWTWTLTAGFPFSWSFVAERREWLLVVPLWVLALAPTRRPRMATDFGDTALGVAKAAGALFLAYLLVFFYAGRDALPRLVALYVLWDCTLLVVGGRLIAWWVLTHAALARRMLVVGDREAVETTIALLDDPHFFDVEAVGALGRLPDATIHGVPVLGGAEAIVESAARLGATGIVVATNEITDDLARQLLHCQEAGMQVTTLATLYEQVLQRVPVRHLGPAWVVGSFLAVPGGEGSPLAKRVLDVSVASVLAVVGGLLLPFIALAVWLDTGRPVFYRQVRLGRGGRPFVLTKFRTMRQHAEADGARWTEPDDPRLTRVGRFLRRSRLDELPNLLAVLRGDLSMVGPRPERPEFVALLESSVPLYRARLTATPGLTGWAQVNFKYGDSVADAAAKLEYDLYYIKHQSLRLDLAIMLRTVGTMLRFTGR